MRIFGKIKFLRKTKAKISHAVKAQPVGVFFCNLNNTIPLLIKSKLSSFKPSFVTKLTIQAGLYQTWLETRNTGYLVLLLISYLSFLLSCSKCVGSTNVSLSDGTIICRGRVKPRSPYSIKDVLPVVLLVAIQNTVLKKKKCTNELHFD